MDDWRGVRQIPEKTKEFWVKLVGRPVLLWEAKILKKLGDACEGFLEADKQTIALVNMQWARILVRVDGWNLP